MTRRDRFIAALYVAIGILLSHVSHSVRFFSVGWEGMRAFPDWSISPKLALLLSPVLAIVVAAALLTAALSRRWVVELAVAVACVFISQAIGRSLLKAMLDLAVIATVAGGYVVRKFYAAQAVDSMPPEILRVFHSEVLGMLRIGVNLSLFVLGTLAISVVSNIIARYFDQELGQVTAWAYVIGLVYLAGGLSVFVVTPLFRTMVATRRRLAANCREAIGAPTESAAKPR